MSGNHGTTRTPRRPRRPSPSPRALRVAVGAAWFTKPPPGASERPGDARPGDLALVMSLVCRRGAHGEDPRARRASGRARGTGPDRVPAVRSATRTARTKIRATVPAARTARASSRTVRDRPGRAAW